MTYSCDVAGFMWGIALAISFGFVCGAALVGICWSTSNIRVDKALNQTGWDLDAEKKAADIKLIEMILEREKANAKSI